MDVLTPKQRSYCMSKIKGSNTNPELILRKALWKKGYRYRTKSKILGKPDMVFSNPKVAIFVDGCFWHKCPRHYTKPKSNGEFWEKKILANISRDKIVNAQLKSEGWKVVRIWECQIKEEPDKQLFAIEKNLKRTEAKGAGSKKGNKLR